MKEKIYHNLYVGSEVSCFTWEEPDWAVVHACKDPCHKNAVGYRGSLPKDHPHYLKYEEGSHLYLNLIDPPSKPLFYQSSFTDALDFVERKINENKVLVHCNEGLSRSPSIVLLYLASEGKITANSSYHAAKEEFQRDYYPEYRPSGGIKTFLNQNWQELL